MGCPGTKLLICVTRLKSGLELSASLWMTQHNPGDQTGVTETRVDETETTPGWRIHYNEVSFHICTNPH
jgi:hypothetical protein